MFILNATINKISKLQNQNINQHIYPYKILNLNPRQTTHIIRKKVSFDYILDVVLIPNISDFKEKNMIDCLWWNAENLSYFKNSAREEILEFMKHHKDITIKDACRILYQPEETIYELKENHYLSFLW